MANLAETFRCFLVKKSGKEEIQSAVEQRPLLELPAGEVLIRVEYSSLNYKDAMAATGHPGVVRRFPHVPGIDAAGTVAVSDAEEFSVGQKVIVTSYELGSGRWGGWSEYVRVPAEWVVPLPESMSTKEAMTYGTAGFTAAQCVLALEAHDVTPEKGEVVVTGATGGVGSFAIQFLARLGYRVAAVTGKEAEKDWLLSLGAARAIDRDEVNDNTDRPLLKAQWSGAVDVIGGNTLATVLRGTDRLGCVAACGLAGGSDLPVSVYPFILRGVTLAGIDSAWCPQNRRRKIWNRLARDWKLENLDSLVEEVRLEGLDEKVQTMLQGEHRGRTIVIL